jgi:rhodanese-related sulfurtransferase
MSKKLIIRFCVIHKKAANTQIQKDLITYYDNVIQHIKMIGMNEAERYFKEKLEFEIDPDTLEKIIAAKNPNYIILDVREKEEYEQGHIPTSIYMSRHEISDHLEKLPKEKKIVIYSHDATCLSAAKVAMHLAEKGFTTMELLGGIEDWKKKNRKIEK